MLGRCIVGAGVIVTLATSGCDRPNAPQDARAVPGRSAALPVPATPSLTVEHLHTLRLQGRYGQLAEFVERTHAASVVDFLLAMDELMVANDEVQAAIRKQTPTAPALEWDLSRLQNCQGLLSADIRVIDERKDGSQAWVSVQVADIMPLETVAMRRIDGRWVYCPESDAGAMPEALRYLSRAMRRMANTITREHLTEDAIRTEVRLRISPYLKRVQSAAATQAPTQLAASSGK